jgi:hypothetical protein
LNGYLDAPSLVLDTPENAFIDRRGYAFLPFALMLAVLEIGADAQIGACVVQAVMVYVVSAAFVLFLKAEDEAMHVDACWVVRVVTVVCSGVKRVFPFMREPGRVLHDGFIIFIIHCGKCVADLDEFHAVLLHKRTVPQGEQCLLPRQNTDPHGTAGYRI